MYLWISRYTFGTRDTKSPEGPSREVYRVSDTLARLLFHWRKAPADKDNDISGLVADAMEEEEAEYPRGPLWTVLKDYMSSLFTNRDPVGRRLFEQMVNSTIAPTGTG